MNLAANPGEREATSRPRLLRWLVRTSVVALLLGLAVGTTPFPERTAAQNDDVRLRIVGTDPFTWDPAQAGDAGTAATLAQVFEGLTAFDAQSQVQPALASSWSIQEDGRRIAFTLRPGGLYSDGSAVGAQDVVDSWFRLLDPEAPSPLVSLLADVQGATAYVAGQAAPEDVGLRAEGDQVIVDFRRPATYFLAVTASPSLAVMPPAMQAQQLGPELPSSFVASGAYRPTVQDGTVIRLEANPNYWAGVPPLEVIEVVTDLGGTGTVAAFEAGDVDHAPIASADATWIRYDEQLGPQLRRTDSFSVHYFGFDTASPPFDDARVRLAFAQAVDWKRMVRLGDAGEPATSIVPPGIPGRGDDDFAPVYDPDAARQLLADAGFAGGEGFPEVTIVSFGYGYEVTVAAELEAALGVSVPVEIMEFNEYFERLDESERPAIWTSSWIADYPHAHGFLGLLLETGSASNFGSWSNSEFDAAIEAAAATNDADEQAVHYATAQEILRREAPVVPVDYGESWALSRQGLVGALESGVGLIRFAGLDWAPGIGR